MGLLAWQWEQYPNAHRDRTNLLLHLFTWPLFVSGVASIVTAPWHRDWRTLVAGVVALPLVMAVQGRGHKMEAQPPAAFRGPLDVVGRIFGEQLVNFPRFLFSGKFFEAWRRAEPSSPKV